MKKIFTLFLLLLVVTTAKADRWTLADGDALKNIINKSEFNNGDTIMLDADTYNITATMNIPSGKSLTIIGAGADNTIIDGGWDGKEYIESNSGVQIFNVGAATASLTLEGVTLQKGKGYEGGAIYSEGSVTLRDCVLKENIAEVGGAILNAGSLIVNNSRFEGNEAAMGGAICTGNDLTIINSVLVDNKAMALGGAIYAIKTALIINTTITGNKCEYGAGGGLFVGLLDEEEEVVESTATILNSIIVGNEADENGKDIYNIGAIDMAYSAYGDYKDGDGGVSAGGIENLTEGITASAVFANPGNSLVILSGSDVATKGTMTAYDGTDGYYFDTREQDIQGLRSAEPRGWRSYTGNPEDISVEEYLLTPIGNTIMGAVFELGDPEPGVHHELTFLVDEGIRINPDKTGYHIEEGHDYTFYMYMNAGFDQKKP